MAAPSYTYTLTNGTTADASQVMQNFQDILNGVSDGTKDLSLNALTCAGTATFNGNVNVGNSSADDLSITASLASSLAIKTNNSFDFGSATLGLRKLYLGNGGAGATCDIVSASHATTREYTVPDCGAAADFVMTQVAQTIAGTKTFSGQLIGKGTATNDSASTGYIGEYVELLQSTAASHGTTGQYSDFASSSISLTAGDWDLTFTVAFYANTGTGIGAETIFGISTTSGNSSSGLTDGINRFITLSPTVVNNAFGCIANYRVSISSTTSYYGKLRSTYTGGQTQYLGRLAARRVR